MPEVIVRPSEATLSVAGTMPAAANPSPPAQLAHHLVSRLRYEGHLSNVLWHISGASWPKIEQSLTRVFDRTTVPARLTALDHNIIRLICGERGVTARQMQLFVFEILQYRLGNTGLQVMRAHLKALYDAQT